MTHNLFDTTQNLGHVLMFNSEIFFLLFPKFNFHVDILFCTIIFKLKQTYSFSNEE